MRRTLIFLFVIIAVLAVIPAQASWVSEILFGRHREYTAAGITYAVDEYIPARWANDSALSVRYWKEGAPVFAGTVLRIGVLLNTGSEDGRIFAICITDPDAVVGATNSRNVKFDLNKDRQGGLRTLGTFVGKYGVAELDTTGFQPGTYFLYSYAVKSRKSWKFSEQAIAIQIAPPLEEVLPAMQNASEEVLRAWGLESYPTLQDIVGRVDSTASCFSVYFADGGRMNDVQIEGSPQVGRYLGVFTSDELAGVVRVDGLSDGVVQSSSSSRFLQKLSSRESDLRLHWVVKTQVYSTKGDCQMTAEQYRNLMTFPDDCRPGSPTFGLRNMVKEMFEAGVVHLNQPFQKNTSLDYQQMYQNWTAKKHTWTVAPIEAYIPYEKTRQVRCVRLGPGGVPIVKIAEATVDHQYTPGLWNGLAYIIGQRIQRPSNISVRSTNNNSNANTNVNTNNNVVNVGEGNATGDACGSGSSDATSGSGGHGGGP